MLIPLQLGFQWQEVWVYSGCHLLSFVALTWTGSGKKS